MRDKLRRAFMIKKVAFHGTLNERTGYGIHASNFVRELSKLIPVNVNGDGDVHISLLDTVTASQATVFPKSPSILMTVWESTEYPAQFIANLKHYDQLWLVSEWEKSCAIAQGIPEEFIKVVPEGVDPDIYKPDETGIAELKQEFHFNFIHVGQWQPRKSTREICEAFIKAFPDNPNVRLYLSADTLFPSDTYQSTEERLTAYGLTDSRIIPVHFEERADYIKRLQSANCFVSCARAEGWGLPIIEAMACGIPTIVCDYSGSTEYAYDAIKVPVKEMIKPFGIYGDWDVPGQWAEPDFEVLVSQMKDVYENYEVHKEKALKTSEIIRTKFSWESAAKKAYEIIQEFNQEVPVDIEKSIRIDARKKGYEITEMHKRKAIFFVDCWPSSQEKMDTLTESIKQIHGFGYPVLVSSHYPLPATITELCDFYIYEKQDIMSGDDKPIYWRTGQDGVTEHKQCGLEYQGVAALNCARNAIDFCRGKYDWIYMMSADMEVDLEDWLSKVHASDKPLVFMAYEGVKNGFGGGLWAATTEMADKVFPYLTSWKQYADMFPDVRFVAERWLYNYIATKTDIDSTVEWIECDTLNRFDNVDRDVWKDDVFQFHFIDGAFLNIAGLSNREYDVTYSTPDGGKVYALKQKPSMWSKPSVKYYKDWTIKAELNGEVKFEHKMDLKGKRVLISMGSKALGDTISWIPYVDEFRKKHGCHVVCSTWWKQIFDYPEVEFVNPGSEVADIYASYGVGCFDDQPDLNPVNWRLCPLQKVAADILGLEYEPIRPKLKYEPKKKGNGNKPKPYICFSEFSTMQNKFWNRPGAWQNVIDHLNSLGYDCVSVSVEKSELKGIISHNGQPIEQTITDISGAEFYVGLNHGPIWIAYALGIPAIMVSGVSEEWNDFPNPYRISVDTGCKPCFNNLDVAIQRGWDWCYSDDKFKCTKNITEEMVYEQIAKIRGEHAIEEWKEGSIAEYPGIDKVGQTAETVCCDSPA
jgi:autotransporter strand-loop-strand O-heptosyltransferase